MEEPRRYKPLKQKCKKDMKTQMVQFKWEADCVYVFVRAAGGNSRHQEADKGEVNAEEPEEMCQWSPLVS